MKRRMTPKEKAEVLRGAAERIFDGRNKWSCCAIGDEQYDRDLDTGALDLSDDYGRMISPSPDRSVHVADFNGANQLFLCKREGRVSQRHRVMALCFIAAVAETGDLPSAF